MLYVFFEHHKDAQGKTLATDVTVSSFLHGKGINWKIDKIPFEAMNRLLKDPPINVRSYNNDLKLWTYIGDAGYHLMEVLQEAFSKLRMQLEFRECEKLEENLQNGSIPEKASKKFDAANFFYNKAGIAQSSEISKPQAIAKLAIFFDLDVEDMGKLHPKDAKKLYREAALKLHPDRNGGDGSKMSELNMYWRVYVS